MTDIRELRADEAPFRRGGAVDGVCLEPGVELEPGDEDGRMVLKLA